MFFFEKKLCFFWKIAKGSKFTVDCNWINKISQNFKNLVFLIKKLDGFFEKLVTFFSKIAKSSKVALQGHCEKKILKTFENLVFFLKKWMGHFDKKNPIFQKIDKGSEFSVGCDWNSNISQHVQRMRYRKQDWLLGKNSEICEKR